jgi:hypothetical protein
LHRAGTGVWTEGLVLALQVLCHLSHSSAPFCVGYFWDRVSCLMPGPLSFYLCFPRSWDDRCTVLCPTFYWMRWGLVNFLPKLALNYSLPDLFLPNSWDYRCELLCPASFHLFLYFLNFSCILMQHRIILFCESV